LVLEQPVEDLGGGGDHQSAVILRHLLPGNSRLGPRLVTVLWGESFVGLVEKPGDPFGVRH
jgi:hypothetical protein